jgi:hypothetical protein
MSRPIPAGDTIEHLDPHLPHHRAWWQAVLEQLVAHEPQALEEGATLRRLWTARQAAAGGGSLRWPTSPLPSLLLFPW